ncbi:MAG TPA: orotate phosphoribosyltransferase [Dehalococcoidia bacterium]
MNQQVLDLFRASGAILEGHFRLTSGLHSPMYLEKFRVLQHPEHTARLCAMIADRFRDAGVQVVAGPTTGGVILAYEVGRQLGVRGIFAERAEGGREFGRGFAIAPGERVLVVDDILTTGGSVRDVLDAVRRHGGRPVGVGVLADRSGATVDFGVPLFACTALHIPTYQPDRCPLCEQGVPLQET